MLTYVRESYRDAHKPFNQVVHDELASHSSFPLSSRRSRCLPFPLFQCYDSNNTRHSFTLHSFLREMMTAARIMLGVSILTMFVGASEFVPTPTTRSSGEIDTRWVFSKGNSYGAPLPPWAEGAAPGWSHCPQSSGNCSPDVPCLEYGTVSRSTKFQSTWHHFLAL